MTTRETSFREKKPSGKETIRETTVYQNNSRVPIMTCNMLSWMLNSIDWVFERRYELEWFGCRPQHLWSSQYVHDVHKLFLAWCVKYSQYGSKHLLYSVSCGSKHSMKNMLVGFNSHCVCYNNNNNNNNDNTSTMFMVLSSCLKHCESSPWFTRWVQHGARWPPTFGPRRSAWTISPPVGCQLTTLTVAILLLLSPKADTHFTIPRKVEGWVDLYLSDW